MPPRPPYHPDLMFCRCGKLRPELGCAYCVECHRVEMEKAHHGELEPIGSLEEESRVERNLGPSGGSLTIRDAVLMRRGAARNGRVLHLNKSIQ